MKRGPTLHRGGGNRLRRELPKPADKEISRCPLVVRCSDAIRGVANDKM